MKPKTGLKIPHIKSCKPITKPKCEIEIFRSVLKSKKNKPNVCLIPIAKITVNEAAIRVTSAFLLVKNFSLII